MTRDYAVFEEVLASKQDILNCSYSKWYDKFSQHAFESTIIKPLPQSFLQYLSSESIRLPSEDKAVVEATEDNEYSDWEGSEGENGGEMAENDPVESFKQLHDDVKQVVRKYKAVAPKLNWSAPKDSTWIMINHSMKCDSASDVYLMLNASDHITHDLDHPFEDGEGRGEGEGVGEEGEGVGMPGGSLGEIGPSSTEVVYELVLRKWQDINPALEFRVFVKNGIVVGKSQRDLNYYDYLHKLVQENDLNEKINQFVNTEIIPKFDNNSFVVDVYIPRPFSKVYVIDFNPFIRVTDSFLYTWTELLNDKEDNIRLITSTNIGRFKTKAYSESQVPLDVIQASQDPNSLAELAKQWQINEKD